MSIQRKRRLRSQANKTYDIKLSFAGVDQAGNEGVAIRGFVPPSEETIPADPINSPVAPFAIDKRRNFSLTTRSLEVFPMNMILASLKLPPLSIVHF